MTEATVTSFNDDRGFGFAQTEDGKLVFLHFSSIKGKGRRTLKIGAKIKFDLYVTDKGYEAQDIEVL